MLKIRRIQRNPVSNLISEGQTLEPNFKKSPTQGQIVYSYRNNFSKESRQPNIMAKKKSPPTKQSLNRKLFKRKAN